MCESLIVNLTYQDLILTPPKSITKHAIGQCTKSTYHFPIIKKSTFQLLLARYINLVNLFLSTYMERNLISIHLQLEFINSVSHFVHNVIWDWKFNTQANKLFFYTHMNN